MPTIFTRMKRPSHLDPPARELYTRPKSHGGSWRLPDEPSPEAADLHPVEVGLLGSAGFSLLTAAVCVFIQILQSMESDPDYREVEKVLDVLFWSLGVFLLSMGLYLVWHRFVRHG